MLMLLMIKMLVLAMKSTHVVALKSAESSTVRAISAVLTKLLASVTCCAGSPWCARKEVCIPSAGGGRTAGGAAGTRSARHRAWWCSSEASGSRSGWRPTGPSR